jgi:uncharacterized protein
MKRRYGIMVCAALCLTACSQEKKKMINPVGYFEIPVTDMERAIGFYQSIFEYSLERETIDGYDMALFPFADGAQGATGALVKGEAYVPAKSGPILYFRVTNIDATLNKAKTAGAAILYAKKDVGAAGFVAEIEDSEGNRIALSQVKSGS